MMLYSGGRPTSVVLLLLVVVSKLTLPLSCQPSLCLHRLLRLIGATRRLLSLAGVEVLQVRLVTASLVAIIRHRLGSAQVSATTAIYDSGRSVVGYVEVNLLDAGETDAGGLRLPIAESGVCLNAPHAGDPKR